MKLNKNISKLNKPRQALIFFLFILILLFTVNWLEKNYLFEKNEFDPSVLIQMSKLLNNAMQKIGRMSCKDSANKADVSQNGGWCSQISHRNSSQHRTDIRLAHELSRFLIGKRVASFGDGPGVYKEILEKLGQVKAYDAFDGAPFVQETTSNTVKFLGISKKLSN
jgi:hypothetical protein